MAILQKILNFKKNKTPNKKTVTVIDLRSEWKKSAHLLNMIP